MKNMFQVNNSGATAEFRESSGVGELWLDGLRVASSDLEARADILAAIGIDYSNPRMFTGTHNARLAAAITRAGEGGIVHITDVYTPRDTVTFLEGQRVFFEGDGAINYPAVISTTLQADVASGASTATLTNPAVFSVGDRISYINKDMNTAAGTARYNHYSSAFTIATINPATGVITGTDVIIMGQASTANLETYLTGASAAETSYTFPSATTIVQKVYNLISAPSSVKFVGLKHDGGWKNASGTIINTFGAWDVCSALMFLDGTISDVEIYDATFTNCASEGIQFSSNISGAASAVDSGAGYSALFSNCKFTNIAGNGIHLSAITNIRVVGGYFKHTNQDLSVGHVNGAIALSYGGDSLTVDGVQFDDVYTPLGKIYTSGTNNISFINNRVKNATYAGFDAMVGAGTTDASTTPRSLIVTGNRFYDSNIVQIGCAATTIGTAPVSRTAGELFNDVTFANNHLNGTRLDLRGITNLKESNNIVRIDYFVPRKIALARLATDTTAVLDAATEVRVGRKVYIVYKGYKSAKLAIKTISTNTVTFTTAIGLLTNAAGLTMEAPANTYVIDAESTPVMIATSTQVPSIATSDYTIPVPDATIYAVNKFLVAGDVSGVPITANRIKAITYGANGANDTITLTAAISANITTNGTRGLDIWPNGFSAAYVAAVAIDGCTGDFDSCTTIGGQIGLTVAGNCTGLTIKVNASGFRNYGIAEAQNSTVTATPTYEGCIATIPSNGFHQWTASPVAGAYGIWISSAARVKDCTVTTTVSTQYAIYQDLGSNAIIEENRCFGLAALPVSGGRHFEYVSIEGFRPRFRNRCIFAIS